MTHSCSHLVIFAYVGTFIKTEKQYLHMWCCTGILWLVIIKVIISFSMTAGRFCMIHLYKAYWIYYRRMNCTFDNGEVNVFFKYPFERQNLRCIVRHEITNHWYPYLNKKCAIDVTCYMNLTTLVIQSYLLKNHITVFVLLGTSTNCNPESKYFQHRKIEP